MGIINILIFTLINGILSSTITLGHNPNQVGLLRSVFELGYIPGSLNSNNPDESVQVIDALLKESCERNGGPRAYDNAKTGWQALLVCDELEKNKIQSIPEEDFVGIMKKYCAIVPTEENCIEVFKHSIEPCLEEEEVESIRIINNVIRSALQFICVDEGARVEKFIADGGQNCVHSRRQALLECINEFSSYYKPAASTYGKSGQSYFKLLPDHEDCVNIENLQHCGFKVLSGCEHHTSADIVNALFNSLKEAIDCKRLLHSQTSTSGAGNVILSTIVMAMFLRF